MSEKGRKIRDFCFGFFGILAVPIIIWFLVSINFYRISVIGILLIIPLALLGFILWAVFRIKNKLLALGFLLGGILPFTISFIITGGCGLLM